MRFYYIFVPGGRWSREELEMKLGGKIAKPEGCKLYPTHVDVEASKFLVGGRKMWAKGNTCWRRKEKNTLEFDRKQHGCDKQIMGLQKQNICCLRAWDSLAESWQCDLVRMRTIGNLIEWLLDSRYSVKPLKCFTSCYLHYNSMRQV